MDTHAGDSVQLQQHSRPGLTMVSMCLAVALVGGACTDGSPRIAASQASQSESQPERIPQPILGDLQVAPDDQRVDLTMPSFSDPTTITNPLFPISSQGSVLLLGHVQGKPFRTEVTLLPETRIIEWQGLQVETLVSQYMAYLDGRVTEVAYDLYAQADDGSVWYFGEDVFDFRDGAIATTEGTWIAGKDGPAAMIMPADPNVGDVYRPENSPDFVFEEVTVTAVDKQLEGPLGPIGGGVKVSELHMDGTSEGKIFAPGYGEFLTAGDGDVEALALAVPTDATSGPVPDELATLGSGWKRIFEAAGSSHWGAASTTLAGMTAAWRTYSGGEVPKRIEPRMTASLDALRRAVGARDAARARQAAIDTAQWTLDLELRYRPSDEIDLARLDLWAAQIQVDAAARDAGDVGGDIFTLDYIRDRIRDSLSGADLTLINIELGELQSIAADMDFAAAAHAAKRLRRTLAGMKPTS